MMVPLPSADGRESDGIAGGICWIAESVSPLSVPVR